MSELRLNVLDADRAICGTIHSSMAEAAVAALSAEPETIEELQDAMARFIKPLNDGRPFAAFDAGTRAEPWDAGIIFIDLAAHIVAAKSSCCMPEVEGRVQYHDGMKATDVWLPYRVPDDWLFLDSVAQYEAVRECRRAERSAAQPLDARPILYGDVAEFIVRECLAARDSGDEDPIAEVHAKWLLTSRSDLRGRSPRDLLLEKIAFIGVDLQSRELQWSFVGEPAPCLSRNSSAYRFAGFGTHEVVVYYDLLRLLLSECWRRVSGRQDISMVDEVAHLKQIQAGWLEDPQPDFGGKAPAYILECERRRLPIIMSAEDTAVDEDCPLCRVMAEDFGPTFWHLDGCNMDHDFPFSFYRTQGEWEAEERRQKRFHDEFDTRWEQRRRNISDDGQPLACDDEVVH
jgi:hypothetical protein